MAIKKISNNVSKIVLDHDFTYVNKETKALIDDLKNKRSIWQSSQTEPVLFIEGKQKPWKDIVYHERWVWGFVLYQNCLYEVTEDHSEEQIRLLVLEFADSERRKFERLRAKFDSTLSKELKYERTPIPVDVRIAVWRRDQGRCVRCGSRENLEYDHIIPVSQGGSNTLRNIELLCEKCNRSKSNNIQ
jgi:hypothetical protein